MATIDLKKEQEATLRRPYRKASGFTKLLFWGMDVLHGKALTPQKVRLLELLARIPYQAWEIHHYHRLNRRYHCATDVQQGEDVIRWGRAAQDNEFWHLQTIMVYIRENHVKLHWFRDRVVAPVAAWKYNFISRVIAACSIKTGFKLNAGFEDHAEHEYMQFVKDHPELDQMPVHSDVVNGMGGPYQSWGDVFRRIGLDEREHMNNSLIRCGRGDEVVPYASALEADGPQA